MKKKKKNVGIDEVLFFPGKFRVGYRRLATIPSFSTKPLVLTMPAMLIGWVEKEMHLMFHYQSLN